LIAGTAGLCAGALAVARKAPRPYGWPIAAAGVAALGFTTWFFRDPKRTPPPHAANLLLAPADGKVVVVEEVHEPLFLKGQAQQVSIFLSPLNVHVNRAPADGTIAFDEYVPGDYLVAWHPKASEKNERSQLGLVHPSGRKILFKQIAGAMARRIVYHIGTGDTVRAGERFGIVKFGSRMDVLVPLDVALNVSVGQRVVAGETVLGTIPQTAPTSEAPTQPAAAATMGA
jgi:phosphatidylserine decarboxylase